MYLKFEESYKCSKCDEDVIQIKCDSSRRLNNHNKFEKHCHYLPNYEIYVYDTMIPNSGVYISLIMHFCRNHHFFSYQDL